MNLKDDIRPLSDFKRITGEILDHLRRSHRLVVLTRHGGDGRARCRGLSKDDGLGRARGRQSGNPQRTVSHRCGKERTYQESDFRNQETACATALR